MDINTALSAVALVIALASAVISFGSARLALRAQTQTRSDVFHCQRDTLILAMADNDIRGDYLTLKTALAREDLERHLLSISDASARAQGDTLLRHVAEIEKIPASLTERVYNEDNLDTLEFSEEALSILRKMARTEQVNAKTLSIETYDLIFKRIEHYISGC